VMVDCRFTDFADFGFPAETRQITRRGAATHRFLAECLK
jgi:hypothetical protein